MKKIFFLTLLCSGSLVMNAQTPYTSVKDDRQVVILNGIISKYILQNDSSFQWYNSSYSGYMIDTTLLGKLEKAKDKHFLIFGGTWCEDTQFILPKFFKLQEKAGIPDQNISFFGVDRSKKTLGNFAETFGISNVPTIIVMKDGKEIGRVVEYGKSGKWDVELAQLAEQP